MTTKTAPEPTKKTAKAKVEAPVILSKAEREALKK